MDFTKFKIFCSSISKLVTNPQGNNLPTEKDLKDFINWVNKDTEKITPRQVFEMQGWILKHSEYNPKALSTTMTDELAKMYVRDIWGKENVGTGGSPMRQQEKGSFAETAAIELLSKIDGINYDKNEKLFENKYFKGKPDIVIEENSKVTKIIEIKVAYDAVTYVEMVAEKTCDSDHIWQVHGYFDVTNCSNAEVVYALVNMPEKMMKAEKQKIIERDRELGIAQSLTDIKIERMVNNMTYDDIPEVVRIHRKQVVRNPLKIKTARSRVSVARKWMKETHDKIQKPLNLQET
jgi:hypothetical protein